MRFRLPLAEMCVILFLVAVAAGIGYGIKQFQVMYPAPTLQNWIDTEPTPDLF